MFNLNRNLPEGKKRKKKHHKDRLSCICISWHSNSKKQTWETDQPCSQPEIRAFAVSLRRLLGANTRVKRPGYVLIVCLRGVREKIRRKGIFSLAVSLWAVHEEIKKQRREKQRTKAFEANIKHNIYNFFWLFLLEWYPLGVKESLDHAQE